MTKLKTNIALVLTGLGLTALSANAAVIASWDGGTGNFADANWTVDGTPGQTHAGFNTDSFTTTIDGGIVNNFNNAVTGNIGVGTAVDFIKITGGATVNADYITVQDQAQGIAIELNNGSITVSDANAFRTSNSGGFKGYINFTGAAGSATIVQTDNTDDPAKDLAGKVSFNTTASYFALDGVMITTGVAYDGTNLAEVNTALEGLASEGRYFQIDETGGTQTLFLVAVPGIPEPSTIVLSSLALLGLGLRRRQLA